VQAKRQRGASRLESRTVAKQMIRVVPVQPHYCRRWPEVVLRTLTICHQRGRQHVAVVGQGKVWKNRPAALRP
jgi:hypothetical protein